jgi:hypothetical protein
MNTIILCAAIGLVVGLIIASRGKRDTGSYVWSTIFGTTIGAVVGLVAAITVICHMVPMKDVVYGPAKLVAMRSSDGISGTFVWGSGSIGNRTTYNFLQRMEDGSMVPGSVPADGLVHLFEDPELKNTGFWSTTMREADKTSSLYPWALATRDRTRILRQEFRVPVGTVVQQFNIK